MQKSRGQKGRKREEVLGQQHAGLWKREREREREREKEEKIRGGQTGQTSD